MLRKRNGTFGDLLVEDDGAMALPDFCLDSLELVFALEEDTLDGAETEFVLGCLDGGASSLEDSSLGVRWFNLRFVSPLGMISY